MDAEALAAMLSKAAAADKQRPLPWPIAMDARYDAATARQLVKPNHTYRVDLSGTGGGGGTGGEPRSTVVCEAVPVLRSGSAPAVGGTGPGATGEQAGRLGR